MCGQAGLAASVQCMLTPKLVNINKLIESATAASDAGKIDNVSNINGSKVYVYHGTKDSVVDPIGGRKTEEMYRHYGADIKTEYNIPADHGVPTEKYGPACHLLSPLNGYINNCNFYGIYEMLNYLQGGDLVRPNKTYEPTGWLSTYDQTEFFSSAPALSSMDTKGFVYIPKGCQNTETNCSLHICFHGCMQDRTLVGDTVPRKAGYMEVADLNDIVVLFPQTVSSVVPVNPSACWDWWGYTDRNFAVKKGRQIAGVYRMMQRLIHG